MNFCHICLGHRKRDNTKASKFLQFEIVSLQSADILQVQIQANKTESYEFGQTINASVSLRTTIKGFYVLLPSLQRQDALAFEWAC